MSFLNRFEARRFSQNGEDGIIAFLAEALDPPRFFVEFGVESGVQCNTRALKHAGWVGVAWDGGYADPDRNIYRERITAENVSAIFAAYRVPPEFGLLSIDIDGNDLHVWRALGATWRPAIVVIEYNAAIPPDQPVSVPYDPAFAWDGTAYFGAGFEALRRLGRDKGYQLVGADARGVNLFFVREDLLPRLPAELVAETETPLALYHPPGYGIPGRGHPPDPRNRPWWTYDG